MLPGRFSEFKKGNRLVYDEERLYENKKKQLERIANRLNEEYCRFAITGEEFISGEWTVVYHYPVDFKFEDYTLGDKHGRPKATKIRQ